MIRLATAQSRLHYRNRKARESGIMPALFLTATQLQFGYGYSTQSNCTVIGRTGLPARGSCHPGTGHSGGGGEFLHRLLRRRPYPRDPQKDQEKQKRNNALWAAEQLGIKLHIEDISEEYKDIVLNPKHGYGANLNPCLDCKIFMVEKANAMLNKARQMADEKGFDFIITGEVIGQRPKSQRKQTLPIIARESGADDRLVRPLCAKLLPPTLPEREGWLDREKLYGFNGRNRKPQLALAKQFGFDDFAQPAGGCCFLTDESYSRKLADLWQAQGRKDYELDDIMLLKVGRHIRPAPISS